MKKIDILKLNKLSGEELEKRELNRLKGGTCCKCCCGYQFEGGSDTQTNYYTNQSYGYTQSYGDNCGCGSESWAYEGQC